MEINENEVAEIFDHMADEYDDLKDLWYSWLFIRIQNFISKDILKCKTEGKCLDVGCGTGFQTFLFSTLGIDTIGIDISKGLIDQAQLKNRKNVEKILKSKFDFINTERQRAINNIKSFNPLSKVGNINFEIGSAINISYDDETFNYINCIGSVISFIEDYKVAIKEMHRVLKPDGVLFLEFENKFNLDIIWTYLDSKFSLNLGYETDSKVAYNRIFKNKKKHIKVEYPFSMHEEELSMNIWLFNTKTLIREIEEIGFDIDVVRSIHSLTNIIPSIKLDNSNPSSKTIKIFKYLSKLEKLFSSSFLLNKYGCSTYLKLNKRDITRYDQRITPTS